MWKRILASVVIIAVFVVVAGTTSTADAHWRSGRWYRGPVLVGPPVVVSRSYYPVRYYAGYGPYWDPRYYRRGISVSVGW